MKKTKHLILAAGITLTAVVSCKKSSPASTSSANPVHTGTVITNTVTDTYSSVNAFFAINGVAMQTYTLNAGTGGSFTTPQGTIVNIPPNAFVTQQAAPVTGNVSIQFKDIYKKSDMLLSNMPTNTYYGAPLKSGGEFFIKALSANVAVTLAPGKKITATQPAALTGGIDLKNTLQPFVAVVDSSLSGWGTNSADSVLYTTTDYVFSLYHFNNPLDSGSWCNSDNSSYFAAYPQTYLTLVPTTNSALNSASFSVFLVFKNISSMVHVYYNSSDANFPYPYAPQGLACTMVAIGVDSKGTLYSSFVPITSIGANQSVNFSMGATTTAAFTSQLKTLD